MNTRTNATSLPPVVMEVFISYCESRPTELRSILLISREFDTTSIEFVCGMARLSSHLQMLRFSNVTDCCRFPRRLRNIAQSVN